MERQPLLDRVSNLVGREDGHASDDSIFLRAAHSPWRPLKQNALGYIRGFVLAYLVIVGCMLLDFEVKHREDEHTNWRVTFQFSTVVWILLIVYHVIVFSWTIIHTHWPDVDPSDNRWKSRLIKFMSPPEQTPDSRKCFYFSLFYTVTHVFALMNVVLYWAWTTIVPHSHGPFPKPGGEDGGGDDAAGFFNDEDNKTPFKDIGAEGWFKPFCLFNIFLLPGLLTLIEVLSLNSIKPPKPVLSHLFGTMGSSGLYLAFAAIGKAATGHYASFRPDEDIVGSKEGVAAYCAGFIFTAAATFTFLYGLIGMRENMVFH